MEFLEQGVFIIVTIIMLGLLVIRAYRIYNSINQGREFEKSGTRLSRIKQMLLIAFGQKKMFKKLIPALLHLSIYLGFLIINLEVLEIVIDGASGKHRFFAQFLKGIYPFFISFFEILALLVVLACAAFLYRRHVIKLKRFQSAEMTSWPKLDASLILIIEIALMFALLMMNASDQILQSRGVDHYTLTGSFLISQFFIPILESFTDSQLIGIERMSWWFHILGIYGFAIYVTYSKHLHIFLAIPASYYSNQNPKGRMPNMAAVTREVKLMLGKSVEDLPVDENAKFGAKDTADLTKKNLLDAYTCTECGRCTEQCPANLTGKTLSPRKIMMDTRDRLENISNKKIDSEKETLLDSHISREELRACTTCNACTEACPINLDPLSIINQLKQYMVMEESSAPAEWNNMFSNIELNQSPWKFPIEDRTKWMNEGE